MNEDEMFSDSVGAEGSMVVARCVKGAATDGDSECGTSVCDCAGDIRSRKMWQRSGKAQNEYKSMYDGAREDAAQWLTTKRPKDD